MRVEAVALINSTNPATSSANSPLISSSARVEGTVRASNFVAWLNERFGAVIKRECC